MAVDVIVGLQRGDEGKGRFVDMLAKDYQIVARFNGGNNAGHTVVLPNGEKLSLHLIPSGIAYPSVMNVIGNGTLINPLKLVEEIDDLAKKGIKISEANLKISSAAHLILPHHIYDDVIREAGNKKQGSTKSGIAQSAADKALRVGARVELIKNDPKYLEELVYQGLFEQRKARAEVGLEPIDERIIAGDFVDKIKVLVELVTDTVFYLNQQLRQQPPAKILAEAAQAFLLDNDDGMYPFTTSSSTTSGGACTGLGIAPSFIGHVTGIAKAIQSHVGDGPFVTEITDPTLLKKLHGDMNAGDAEKGTTTGRIRRLGNIDIPQIRRAQMVNAKADEQDMALTKVDWVPRYGDVVPICVAYMRKGKKLVIAPDAAYKLEQSVPVYANLPTWKTDISTIRSFRALPVNAQNYIKFIEDLTGIRISMIGVGPRRDQVIIR